MSRSIHNRSSLKEKVRARRRRKIRSIVSGTTESPRLSVFRSNANLYVQLVDDTKGITLASASTQDAELKGTTKCNIESAKTIGGLIAKRAQAKKVNKVVFDRGGYPYHGRIKALADAAREGGLKF